MRYFYKKYIFFFKITHYLKTIIVKINRVSNGSHYLADTLISITKKSRWKEHVSKSIAKWGTESFKIRLITLLLFK